MGSLGLETAGHRCCGSPRGSPRASCIESAWKLSTGSTPPENPEDPRVAWEKAVVWALLEGAFIGMARLVATRKAAEYYERPPTGHLPEAMEAAGDPNVEQTADHPG